MRPLVGLSSVLGLLTGCGSAWAQAGRYVPPPRSVPGGAGTRIVPLVHSAGSGGGDWFLYVLLGLLAVGLLAWVVGSLLDARSPTAARQPVPDRVRPES